MKIGKRSQAALISAISPAARFNRRMGNKLVAGPQMQLRHPGLTALHYADKMGRKKLLRAKS